MSIKSGDQGDKSLLSPHKACEEQVPLTMLTIEQVMAQLQLSRGAVYNLINREGLPTIHFGAAVRIRSEALRDWLVAREQAERDERQQSINPFVVQLRAAQQNDTVRSLKKKKVE